MNADSGIIYVATGEVYNRETVRSAKSAKAHMPDLPVVLFTDQEPAPQDAACFDEIRILSAPSRSFDDKILPLKSTPFRKTLFVDTDTVFLDPVPELFDLLERFDLAYCHAPNRIGSGENNRVSGVPDCFPEANTGVLLYNNIAAFRDLVDAWDKIYARQRCSPAPPSHDQPAFRQALYHSGIKSYVLPPEYNLRTPLPMFKGAGLNAKILHGRGASLERALKVVGPAGRRFGLYDFTDKPSLPARIKSGIRKRLKYSRWGFLVR